MVVKLSLIAPKNMGFKTDSSEWFGRFGKGRKGSESSQRKAQPLKSIGACINTNSASNVVFAHRGNPQRVPATGWHTHRGYPSLPLKAKTQSS